MTELTAAPALHTLDVETITAIIRAAEAYAEASTTHAEDGIESIIRLFRGEDADYERLFSLVNELPREARYELCAVMWLGRGDGDDFRDLVAYAERMDTGTEEDARYIVSKAPLAEYLTVGIRKLETAA